MLKVEQLLVSLTSVLSCPTQGQPGQSASVLDNRFSYFLQKPYLYYGLYVLQITVNKVSTCPLCRSSAEVLKERLLGYGGRGPVQQQFFGGKLKLLSQHFSPILNTKCDGPLGRQKPHTNLQSQSRPLRRDTQRDGQVSREMTSCGRNHRSRSAARFSQQQSYKLSSTSP